LSCFVDDANRPASEKDLLELKALMNDWRVHELLKKCVEWYDAEQKKQLESQFTSGMEA
jgi:hypothetical protein